MIMGDSGMHGKAARSPTRYGDLMGYAACKFEGRPAPLWPKADSDLPLFQGCATASLQCRPSKLLMSPRVDVGAAMACDHINGANGIVVVVDEK